MTNFWDEVQDIIKLSDGRYIIAGKSFPSKTQGNLWVMKISQSGEIVWESQHNGGRTRNSPISISVSKVETSVFIAGYGRLPNNKENYILWSLNPITGVLHAIASNVTKPIVSVFEDCIKQSALL